MIKFERNVDTRVASITCKYKGFDRDLVASFPVRVSPLYPSSAKLELDVHPTFARNAISLVARVPYDIRISCFHDIEAIFPGFLAFSRIEPWQPVVVRMYKASAVWLVWEVFVTCLFAGQVRDLQADSQSAVRESGSRFECLIWLLFSFAQFRVARAHVARVRVG